MSETILESGPNGLGVAGKSGEHAILRRAYDDPQSPERTFSFDGDEEVEWAIEQLQRFLEGDADA